MFSKTNYPFIVITDEMITEAEKLISSTKVERTITSEIDTLTGHLGEFVFAQYYFGDWKKNRVGKNRGESDFPNIEIKTSAFPFNANLNLLVREDYAKKRNPRFYVQIIIDVDDRRANIITAGAKAYLCGFATAVSVDKAPLKDFGSKLSSEGGYKCHYINNLELKPMNELKREYERMFSQ